MHVKIRLPYLTGVLLLAAAPFAGAESPLPDPVAPAVIGRPLDQIRPARIARQKSPAAQPTRSRQVAAASKAVPARPAAVQAPAAQQQVAKQAVTAVPAPRTYVAGNVGQAARFAAPPPALGAYFSDKDQALVRRYYEAQPVAGAVPQWKVGDPIPPKAALAGVPDGLRAALPALPPGHQYVQLDGEVVLVAVQSRRVVDRISRGAR